MSDDPKKPGDPAAEATRPDEEESPKLREVSQEKLKDILAAHEKWVKSGGKEGKQADLQGVNLRKAVLIGANLREADLSSANLQKANLAKANLQEADLIKTNLREANLHGANLRKAALLRADLRGTHLFRANLQGADLQHANLQEANLGFANLQGAGLTDANLRSAKLGHATLREATLQDADLTDVKGLLAEQLAGANVSGATLPEDIAKFKGLDHVTEISKHARNIFLAAIGGCVFSWLTIVTTTDVALLTNTASTPLPIIQTKVPIAGFYFAAPLILLSLYIYLHMYLQRLWSGLAGLPAIFPDGRHLDERAYPWLLTSLVGANVPRLKEDRPPFSRQQVLLSILTAWCLVPGTIGWFWLRYLPVHDWTVTGVHIALVALAVTAGVGYFWRAQATLRGRQLPHFTWKIWRWRSPVPFAHAALFLGLAAAAIIVSDGAINGVPLRSDDYDSAWGHRKLVPAAFDLVGFRTALDIGQEDISIRPANWTGLGKKPGELTAGDLAMVKGAKLVERDLRHAFAFGAFLVKANLRIANLQGAKLERANLQKADLQHANLQGANLSSANLQGANLFNAKLQGANLRVANLQGADLSRANLQGAELLFANLQGAVLKRANLQKANLEFANLQGADLQGANLQKADLQSAKLQETKLEKANLQQAKLRNTNLQGADLRGATLQGANLRHAELQKANLLDANLQEINLFGAKLQGADLQGANLQGADFSFADLHNAKGLTQDQLDKACGNAKTQLPLGMSIPLCPNTSK